MSVVELRTAVLARNDGLAAALRDDLAAVGAAAVNLLSSPGSGKTALLELLLSRCRDRGVPVAALTGDLATENDARRLARSGAPVRQVVTEGEDKPVKYPTAYRWADLVVVTKVDLAAACAFDDEAFASAVRDVTPDAPVLRTSARTGEGVETLLDILLQTVPGSTPDPSTTAPRRP